MSKLSFSSKIKALLPEKKKVINSSKSFIRTKKSVEKAKQQRFFEALGDTLKQNLFKLGVSVLVTGALLSLLGSSFGWYKYIAQTPSGSIQKAEAAPNDCSVLTRPIYDLDTGNISYCEPDDIKLDISTTTNSGTATLNIEVNPYNISYSGPSYESDGNIFLLSQSAAYTPDLVSVSNVSPTSIVRSKFNFATFLSAPELNSYGEPFVGWTGCDAFYTGGYSSNFFTYPSSGSFSGYKAYKNCIIFNESNGLRSRSITAVYGNITHPTVAFKNGTNNLTPPASNNAATNTQLINGGSPCSITDMFVSGINSIIGNGAAYDFSSGCIGTSPGGYPNGFYNYFGLTGNFQGVINTEPYFKTGVPANDLVHRVTMAQDCTNQGFNYDLVNGYCIVKSAPYNQTIGLNTFNFPTSGGIRPKVELVQFGNNLSNPDSNIPFKVAFNNILGAIPGIDNTTVSNGVKHFLFPAKDQLDDQANAFDGLLGDYREYFDSKYIGLKTIPGLVKTASGSSFSNPFDSDLTTNYESWNYTKTNTQKGYSIVWDVVLNCNNQRFILGTVGVPNTCDINAKNLASTTDSTNGLLRSQFPTAVNVGLTLTPSCNLDPLDSIPQCKVKLVPADGAFTVDSCTKNFKSQAQFTVVSCDANIQSIVAGMGLTYDQNIDYYIDAAGRLANSDGTYSEHGRSCYAFRTPVAPYIGVNDVIRCDNIPVLDSTAQATNNTIEVKKFAFDTTTTTVSSKVMARNATQSDCTPSPNATGATVTASCLIRVTHFFTANPGESLTSLINWVYSDGRLNVPVPPYTTSNAYCSILDSLEQITANPTVGNAAVAYYIYCNNVQLPPVSASPGPSYPNFDIQRLVRTGATSYPKSSNTGFSVIGNCNEAGGVFWNVTNARCETLLIPSMINLNAGACTPSTVSTNPTTVTCDFNIIPQTVDLYQISSANTTLSGGYTLYSYSVCLNPLTTPVACSIRNAGDNLSNVCSVVNTSTPRKISCAFTSTNTVNPTISPLGPQQAILNYRTIGYDDNGFVNYSGNSDTSPSTVSPMTFVANCSAYAPAVGAVISNPAPSYACACTTFVGATSNTCNNKGTYTPGSLQATNSCNNSCSCNVGYDGVNCELCALGYAGYPNCTPVCANGCTNPTTCNTPAIGSGYNGTSCAICNLTAEYNDIASGACKAIPANSAPISGTPGQGNVNFKCNGGYATTGTACTQITNPAQYTDYSTNPQGTATTAPDGTVVNSTKDGVVACLGKQYCVGGVAITITNIRNVPAKSTSGVLGYDTQVSCGPREIQVETATTRICNSCGVGESAVVATNTCVAYCPAGQVPNATYTSCSACTLNTIVNPAVPDSCVECGNGFTANTAHTQCVANPVVSSSSSVVSSSSSSSLVVSSTSSLISLSSSSIDVSSSSLRVSSSSSKAVVVGEKCDDISDNGIVDCLPTGCTNEKDCTVVTCTVSGGVVKCTDSAGNTVDPNSTGICDNTPGNGVPNCKQESDKNGSGLVIPVTCVKEGTKLVCKDSLGNIVDQSKDNICNVTAGDGIPDCPPNGLVVTDGTKSKICDRTVDFNCNGIADKDEASKIPNKGDANGDGIPDYKQLNVQTVFNPDTKKSITVFAEGSCNKIENIAYIAEKDLKNQDAQYDYPQGLVSYSLKCADPKAKVNEASISLIWQTDADPATSELRKYGPLTPGDSNQQYYTFKTTTKAQSTIGGVKIIKTTFKLVDGESGDSTGKDGKIIDPVGLGVQDPRYAANQEAAKTGVVDWTLISIIVGSSVALIASGVGVWWFFFRRR
jgi:hypothetical protein